MALKEAYMLIPAEGVNQLLITRDPTELLIIPCMAARASVTGIRHVINR